MSTSDKMAAKDIYEEIEAKLAAGPITRQQAFEAMADETGKPAGTISAGYYREARKRGGGRTPISAKQRAGRPPKAKVGEREDPVFVAVADLALAVARLQEALAQREDTVAKMRALLNGG